MARICRAPGCNRAKQRRILPRQTPSITPVATDTDHTPVETGTPTTEDDGPTVRDFYLCFGTTGGYLILAFDLRTVV